MSLNQDKQLNIKLDNIVVCINIISTTIKKEILSICETLIPFKIVSKNEIPDFIIELTQNKIKKLINLSGCKVIIQDDWSNGLPGYFPYFLLKIFSSLLASTNCLGFHSSCVGIKGKAIMLLGNPGDGKTNTALTLSLRYGASLKSSNRTFIKKKKEDFFFSAGTISLELRAQDLSRYKDHILFPEIFKNFYEKKEMKDSYTPNHTSKLPNRISCLAKDKVGKIFIIKLSKGVEENFKLNKIESRLELYKNQSAVYNNCLLFDGKSTSDIDIDPRTKQLSLIDSLIQGRDIIVVKGSMDYICNKIMEESLPLPDLED